MTSPSVQMYQSLISIAVYLQQISVIIVVGIFFMRLSKPYFKERKWRAYIAGVLYSVMILLFYLIPEEFQLPKGVTFLVRVTGGFLILYTLEHRNLIQKLFLSLCYYTLTYIAVRMTSEQNGFFSDAVYQLPVVIEDVDNTMAGFYIIEIEYVLVLILILSFGVFFLHKACSFYPEDLNLKDMLLLSIPPVMQVFSSFLYMDHYNLYVDYGTLLGEIGNNEKLQSLTWASWLRFFDSLIFFIFWMVFLKLFSDFMQASKDKVQSAILKEQIAQVKTKVAHAESIHQEISGLRHDMSHHIMVISNLLEQDNIKEAKEYIDRIGSELAKSRQSIITGHPVTDAVLSEAEQEAKNKGFSFDCDFIFPKKRNIDAFDLSVILGNGLSNAIRCCEDKGGISVRSFIKKGVVLIEIKNTYVGSWVKDKETGFPMSERSKDGHGLGLLNIQRVTKKYNGSVILEKKGDEAVLSVLLQTKDNEKDPSPFTTE